MRDYLLSNIDISFELRNKLGDWLVFKTKEEAEEVAKEFRRLYQVGNTRIFNTSGGYVVGFTLQLKELDNKED